MNETENIECPAIGDMLNKKENNLLKDTINKKTSGIYKIINKVNGKYYVGSSNDINGPHGRWYEHINNLKASRHDNNHLQKSWNKYGESAFEFVIIKEVPLDKLLSEEQIFLDIAKLEKNKTYNMNFLSTGGAGFTDHKHTEESKRKTSLKMKGVPKRTKGIKRPHTSGYKNPQWKFVDANTKNILMETYKVHGYTALKLKAREFGFGGTVTHRLSKEFNIFH